MAEVVPAQRVGNLLVIMTRSRLIDVCRDEDVAGAPRCGPKGGPKRPQVSVAATGDTARRNARLCSKRRSSDTSPVSACRVSRRWHATPRRMRQRRSTGPPAGRSTERTWGELVQFPKAERRHVDRRIRAANRTKPSLSRRRNASRTGVGDTPSSRASVSWFMPSPGAKEPVRMFQRRFW